jgi:hypothetical protein
VPSRRLEKKTRAAAEPHHSRGEAAQAGLMPTWEAGPNARMINLSALEVPGSPVAVLEVRIHLPPAGSLRTLSPSRKSLPQASCPVVRGEVGYLR